MERRFEGTKPAGFCRVPGIKCTVPVTDVSVYVKGRVVDKSCRRVQRPTTLHPQAVRGSHPSPGGKPQEVVDATGGAGQVGPGRGRRACCLGAHTRKHLARFGTKWWKGGLAKTPGKDLKLGLASPIWEWGFPSHAFSNTTVGPGLYFRSHHSPAAVCFRLKAALATALSSLK